MKHHKGFTLLEVMLAVAVMGVAVVTLLLIQSEAVRTGGEADRLRQLSILAAEKLQELSGGKQDSASGDFPEPHAGYRYSYASEPAEWKTPSKEESGTDPALVETLEMKKHTLTVTSPDGTMSLVLVDYSFPHEEAKEEEEPPKEGDK